mgnify:CR=1 FL=1
MIDSTTARAVITFALEKGWTQERVAKALGVTRGTISHRDNERSSWPEKDLRILARRWNVPLKRLLSGG